MIMYYGVIISILYYVIVDYATLEYTYSIPGVITIYYGVIIV